MFTKDQPAARRLPLPSHAIDRLVYGEVTDFLDFHSSGWHWPAFNGGHRDLPGRGVHDPLCIWQQCSSEPGIQAEPALILLQETLHEKIHVKIRECPGLPGGARVIAAA